MAISGARLCLKSQNEVIWQWGFSLMPQRGYGLQPRVAASATLGSSKKRNFNRNAVASFARERNAQSRRNRVAVEDKSVFFTQGSGNPGLEAVAPLGHH
jgi:hypothetical protein